VYSDAEVIALMTAARALSSPLRAATDETFIGLLAVTQFITDSPQCRLDRRG